MAGNPIASLFAQLGFRVDRTGLKSFQKDLATTAKQIDSSSKKSVGGATKSAREKQSKFFKEISANYSKVRPNLMQMQRDLKRIEGAFAQNRITHKEYMEARRRVTEQIGKVEKQKESAHQRALKETATQERALQKQREMANKKRVTALDRIEKAYDKHRFQLKQVRADYRFVNQEFKKGNISIEHRERQLTQLIAKYRQLQAAQAGTAGGRVGSAGGAFAGGRDPRQKGTHNVISAIHSDVGLGVMAGSFAIAQSSRAFQNVKAMEQGLAAATGSFEQGAAEMEYLIQLSQKLGLFVGDLGEDYAKFAASARDTNLTAKDQREVFKGVAAQVKILNLSAADSKRIFRALSQMMSSGQIMAQELKLQMGDQLPGAMRAMARAAHNLGITQDDSIASMNKAMEAGLLLSEEVLPEFSKELWEAANQGGALEEAMKSTNAAFGRFQTNVWLSNKIFQEAGMDKGIRDLANSASDFLMRADELWTLMGRIGPVLFYPFRALFEIFGAISDKFGEFTDKIDANQNLVKWLGLLMMSLFGWSRKLLFTFLIIPAALSNIAAVIDGEQLTWSQWLTTLLGVLGALTGIAKIASKAKGVLGGDSKIPLKAGAGAAAGGLMGSLLKAGTMKVAVVSFLGLSAFGALASMIYDAFFGAGPSARTGAQFGDKFGSNLALPQSSGGGIPERIRNTLQTPASEFQFGMPNISMPDFIHDFNYRLNRTAESQAITSGDITFNITGDNSKEIADEVLRVIHSDVIRPTSMNDPSQEK